jgi:hypothetical protein
MGKAEAARIIIRILTATTGMSGGIYSKLKLG